MTAPVLSPELSAWLDRAAQLRSKTMGGTPRWWCETPASAYDENHMLASLHDGEVDRVEVGEPNDAIEALVGEVLRLRAELNRLTQRPAFYACPTCHGNGLRDHPNAEMGRISCCECNGCGRVAKV